MVSNVTGSPTMKFTANAAGLAIVNNYFSYTRREFYSSYRNNSQNTNPN